jgi:hypothetical protein
MDRGSDLRKYPRTAKARSWINSKRTLISERYSSPICKQGNITTFLSRLSPAESHLYGLLEKLYKKYPEIYTLSMSPESFQKFNGGERKNVNAISGNQYENIEDAILSLVAVNVKKDLKAAIDDFRKASNNAANKKRISR